MSTVWQKNRVFRPPPPPPAHTIFGILPAAQRLFIYFLFGLVIAPNWAIAQTDTTEYPAPYTPEFLFNRSDTCSFPIVTLAPVIHYQQGTIAYLEFTEVVSQIRLQEPDAIDYTTIWVNGNSKLIENLEVDKKYEVFTLSRCGEFEPAGMIDTKSGEKETVEVSAALYDAIRDFQYQEEGEALPLGQFLNARDDVSFFEKVYFIQQYFLKGQQIAAFSDTELPDFMPPTICNCVFVFNLSQDAVPGNKINGTIYPDVRFQPKQPMQGNSYNASWWNRNTKGAAKWHQLWTEGSKAGSQDTKYEMKMADSTATVGTQYGQLRYNYLCTNYEQVPADCQCAKGLYLYWRYDTEVCAHAERHTEGWGQKNAVAAAEDASVVVLRRDGTNLPIVLDGGIARAEAECDKKVNPEFWLNVTKLAADITKVVLGLTSDSLTTIQQSLFNQGSQHLDSSLTALFHTPYYSVNFCNSDNCREVTPCFGDTLVYMQPNEPINLYVFSNTSLMAGGKRSWFSWSRVLSDFYLAGYVPGGYLSEEQMYCCTKKYGNWVLASELGSPHSTADLKNEVGNIFSAWAPWPFPKDPFSGIVQIPYEYYAMAVPVVECPDGGNFTGGADREARATEDNLPDLLPRVYTIYVFDLSGRLLYQNKSSGLPVDFRSYLKTNIPSANAGIYIIQAVSAGERLVFKTLLN